MTGWSDFRAVYVYVCACVCVCVCTAAKHLARSARRACVPMSPSALPPPTNPCHRTPRPPRAAPESRHPRGRPGSESGTRHRGGGGRTMGDEGGARRGPRAAWGVGAACAGSQGARPHGPTPPPHHLHTPPGLVLEPLPVGAWAFLAASTAVATKMPAILKAIKKSRTGNRSNKNFMMRLGGSVVRLCGGEVVRQSAPGCRRSAAER